MKASKLIPLLFLSIALAAPSHAKSMAVLIGVSDYEFIDADLKGPANDVVLMAETLSLRGMNAADIWILSSAYVQTNFGILQGDPTRSNILNFIQSAGAETHAGDDLVVYYSGHGSTAPDQNGDEAGGQDEILLPSDVKKWSGASGTVEGAIVDDEWVAILQPILDKGVKVIGILDACHSSTGFRGMSNGVARYVAPETLGIPSVDLDTGPSDAATLNGDFVFLYSAQSDERAFEYPHGADSDASSWHGDFTYSLSNALVQPHVISWRDALFVSQNLMNSNGPAPQTPAGEGTLLDTQILGTAPAQRSYAVSGNTLEAGLVHGLNIGAIIEISDKSATITDITARSATLSADFDLPANGTGIVISHGPTSLAKISTQQFDGNSEFSYQNILVEGFQWSDTDADYYLNSANNQVALSGKNETFASAVQSGAPIANTQAQLEEMIANAVHLFRIRNSLSSLSKTTKTGFTLPSSDMKVSLHSRSANNDCTPSTDQAKASEPIRLKHCDQLWLNIENPSSTPRDVTVLYVNQDRSISPIWPEQGLSNRISIGEAQEIGLELHNTTGAAILEQLIIIAVPASDGQLETDLTYLASPETETSRGGKQTPASRWFSVNLNPETSERGFGIQPPEIIVSRYNIQIDRR